MLGTVLAIDSSTRICWIKHFKFIRFVAFQIRAKRDLTAQDILSPVCDFASLSRPSQISLAASWLKYALDFVCRYAYE